MTSLTSSALRGRLNWWVIVPVASQADAVMGSSRVPSSRGKGTRDEPLWEAIVPGVPSERESAKTGDSLLQHYNINGYWCDLTISSDEHLRF